MKIYLAHSKFVRSWDSEWIYIGRDYIQMRKWEKKCSCKRVSIAEEINQIKDKYLNDYLEWIEEQRTENKDSLNWWISYIAGRNNLTSFFYLHICQLIALHNWLDVNYKNQELLIVCDDIFLLNTVKLHLSNKYFVKSFWRNAIYSLRDWSYSILRVIYIFLRTFAQIYKYTKVAKKTKFSSKEQSIEDEIYLVQLCLDDKSFLNEAGKLSDRYFGILPEWLESKGKKVLRLPWLFNINLPLQKVFQRLRKDECIIIWDHLRLSDLKNAFIEHIKSFWVIKNNKFLGFSLDALILKERLLQLSTFQNIFFWLHIPFIQRYKCKFKKIVVMNTFERNQAEIPIVKTLSRDVAKSIGYYHSLTTKDYFSFHSILSEWNSSAVPDIIVTNGKISKKILVKQGAPEERIVAGPALRQKKVAYMEKSKESKNLTLLLSMELMATYELIENIYSINEWIQKDLKIQIKLKPHPMTNILRIMKFLGLERLPENWFWEEKEIYEVLKNSYCVAALTTASVYDAVIAGCIVVPIRKELDFMGNYLDIFEYASPLLKSVQKQELKSKLIDIYIDQPEYYKQEFEKVRNELQEGLGDINDETLSVFLN